MSNVLERLFLYYTLPSPFQFNQQFTQVFPFVFLDAINGRPNSSVFLFKSIDLLIVVNVSSMFSDEKVDYMTYKNKRLLN